MIPRANHRLAVLVVCGLIAGSSLTLQVPEAFPGVKQEVVVLDTRPGVNVKLLLITPETPASGIFILLEGGEGLIFDPIHREGFLVRTAHLFAAQGFLTAVVDVPSDHASGINPEFRAGKEHLEDVEKVVEFLEQRWAGPIFLVGQSMGSISAANAGASLRSDRFQAVILTSSGVRGLSAVRVPLENITVPVLLVHHQNDGCNTLDAAKRIMRRFVKSLRTGFMEVSGGNPVRSGRGSAPCGPLSSHGFPGKEREVVTAITDWVTGKPVSDRIGP